MNTGRVSKKNAFCFLGRWGMKNFASRQGDSGDVVHVTPGRGFSTTWTSRAVGWQVKRKLIGAKWSSSCPLGNQSGIWHLSGTKSGFLMQKRTIRNHPLCEDPETICSPCPLYMMIRKISAPSQDSNAQLEKPLCLLAYFPPAKIGSSLFYLIFI